MLNSFKKYLQNIEITATNWLTLVSGVFFVRFFLEAFSSQTARPMFFTDLSTILHYYLFFLALSLVFVIFIQKFLPDFKKVAPQLVATSLFVIFIAPIIDFGLTLGEGSVMTYLIEPPRVMWHSFLTFFGNNFNPGITVGMRIEIAIILLFVGIISYLSSKKISKSIFLMTILYGTIFFFVSLPGFVYLFSLSDSKEPILFFQKSIIESSTIANNVQSYLKYDSEVTIFSISFNFLMARILLFLSIILAGTFFFLNFKQKFKAVIANSRPERVLHYLMMILIGIFSAYVLYPDIKLNWNDWSSIFSLCLAFYFSWMFAVCINDIEDIEIDALTNKDRPLIQNSLSKEDMKQASNLFLLSSFIAGYLAGYAPFFFLTSFTSLYYIYSSNPTRFKMIPFLSSFLIGLCCLTAVAAGFFVVSPVKDINVFPSQLVLMVVTIFFLGAHVRDMKDIEGDRASGIPTVPVIFGDIWGPRLVGVFAALSFLLVPVFSKIYILFVTALPASLFTYYLINKKPYSEKPIFKTYFIFVLLSLALLLF